MRLLIHAAVDIRFINQDMIPLDIKAGVSIRHLSRVRKLRVGDFTTEFREILLCAEPSTDRRGLLMLMEKHMGFILQPQLILASKWPAYTRSQFDEFCLYWPVKVNSERKR
jgi:hypothetical protein